MGRHFFRQETVAATLSHVKRRETESMEHLPSPEIWQRWLDEHAGRLLLFARQQCRFPADAEDVLQEALVEAWERTGRQGLPQVALVYATIHRRAIDQARSDDRRRRREQAGSTNDEPWFDTGVADAERRALVEAGMKVLPDIYREVVTLKIWGGLTFEEIAAALEIPANTAASRYRYGLETLRKHLKSVMA